MVHVSRVVAKHSALKGGAVEGITEVRKQVCYCSQSQKGRECLY